MDDSASLVRAAAFGVAGYPIYLARTLMQIGYEPVGPDANGTLPNIFTYIAIIKSQRGYLSLYTGLRYYLPAVVLKQAATDLISYDTPQKSHQVNKFDTSKVLADCLYESAVKIYTTLMIYPIVTMGVGMISASFFGEKEVIEYSLKSSYNGIIPKLIVEVTMVWVSLISKRLTMSMVEDDLAQAIISRVPPFIVQTLLYPFNVVSTVMADNGRSGMNPQFEDWRKCYQYLSQHNQLKRGSSFISRRAYQGIPGSRYSIMKFF